MAAGGIYSSDPSPTFPAHHPCTKLQTYGVRRSASILSLKDEGESASSAGCDTTTALPRYPLGVAISEERATDNPVYADPAPVIGACDAGSPIALHPEARRSRFRTLSSPKKTTGHRWQGKDAFVHARGSGRKTTGRSQGYRGTYVAIKLSQRRNREAHPLATRWGEVRDWWG